MSAVMRRGTPVILITLIAALMLSIMPLFTWAEEIRPYFVLMVVMYWAMALPHRVSIGVAWIMGLLLDVSYDAVLGQYALAMALIAFFTVNLHQRLRVFPLWQQAIVVFVFAMIYSLIVLWIKGITGNAPSVWTILIPCFTTAILWPPAFLLLRKLRRFYSVS
jgi:rod shape-determining protein MreD